MPDNLHGGCAGQKRLPGCMTISVLIHKASKVVVAVRHSPPLDLLAATGHEKAQAGCFRLQTALAASRD